MLFSEILLDYPKKTLLIIFGVFHLIDQDFINLKRFDLLILVYLICKFSDLEN